MLIAKVISINIKHNYHNRKKLGENKVKTKPIKIAIQIFIVHGKDYPLATVKSLIGTLSSSSTAKYYYKMMCLLRGQ